MRRNLTIWRDFKFRDETIAPRLNGWITNTVVLRDAKAPGLMRELQCLSSERGRIIGRIPHARIRLSLS